MLPAALLALLIARPGMASLTLFTKCTGGCVLLTIVLQLLVDARAIVQHAGRCMFAAFDCHVKVCVEEGRGAAC